MTQKESLSHILKSNPEAIAVSSLGTISYDLKEIDHPEKVLVKGAMGCAIAVGLGIALSSKKKVIVFIGEGSLIMKYGSLATVNRYKPKNLEIYVVDNGVYASCGGQENNYHYFNESICKHL